LRGQRYCDLLFLDLDSKDGFVLVIENKLFTRNHPGQLASYFEAIESKFARTKVREFVYLTLTGECPVIHNADDREDCRRWIRLSWLSDVRAILRKVAESVVGARREVTDLIALLDWVDSLLVSDESIDSAINRFSDELVQGAAECLLEELNRIGAREDGWSAQEPSPAHWRLQHSSSPKSRLHIKLLSNHDLSIQGRRRSQALFERIVIPMGCHPDQMLNLIDVAAREVYHGFFNRPTDKLGTGRRLRKTMSSAKQRHERIFRFAHSRRSQLRVLLSGRGMSNGGAGVDDWTIPRP
jgi:hypothetical protein